MSNGSASDIAVITDTSCFILLDKINALEILHLTYEHVFTTPQIASEYKKALPSWVSVVPVKAIELIIEYSWKVDLGEASAIALAIETPNALLVLDDFKGRRLATQLQLKFVGTLGVFIKARQQLIIKSVRPYFESMKSTDFRIDHNLLDRIMYDFGD